MTVFGHDPLETLLLLAGIFGALAVGWSVWRAKSAEIAAAASESWESLARAYQEKLEQRDQAISDMKAQHAAETAELRAQVEELRRQVDVLRERDQTAVLELLRSHETTAAERHVKQLEVLVEIRDALVQAA